MKKLWVGVLIVAIVALVAMLSYNPQSDSDSDTQTPNSDAGTGQNVITGVGDETDDVYIPLTDNNSEIDAPQDSASGISASELGKHDSKSDCWVAYDGKVYDITSFLPVHPGSSAAIEPYCGTEDEFTNAFEGQHGTSQVKNLIKRGTLKGDLI
jgi:cytochrome b involved in lipid metabolism